MTNKKAISPIITTILLILISIVAVSFVAAFVIPFIKNNMNSDCFKAINQITIKTNSGFTCYHVEGGKAVVNVSVQRGNEPLGIETFKVTVLGEGESETFTIRNEVGRSDGKVKMLKGMSQDIEVPKVGDMKTYVLYTDLASVNSVQIAAGVSGDRMCDPTEEKQIDLCTAL
jgi:hypothetical protein